MKKFGFFLLLASFAFATQSFAQTGRFGATPEDSAECVKYLSFYKDYYKAGNIKESIPSWRGAVKICPPSASQALYQDGQNIVKFMINQATDPDRKKELVDSLMLMYDTRITHYPTSKSLLSAYTFKAYDMIIYCQDQEQAIYNALQDVVRVGGVKADQGILVLNMQYAINLFKSNLIEADQVVELYENLGSLFEQKLSLASGDTALEEAKSNFETLFAVSGVANCENLLALFGPQFDDNAADVTYVKRVVQLLANAGCETSDLFLKSVETLYNLEPSATSAYYLYRLYSSRGENNSALEFLQKAIDDPELPDATRGEYLMTMGSFYFKNMNNYTRAMDAARKAMEADKAQAGKANLLIGHIWANSRPNVETDIDERANFWVAVDYFARAKSNDSSLAEECNKLIATYSQYFPTVEEAFMHDLTDGTSYTVTCPGMQATTTVRTRK